MSDSKPRDIRLDIIRIFSFFCVVGIHFFLNSNFYNCTIDGKKELVMCIMRSLFFISVPMFITLTGYLMCNKTLSKKYYKGITKTLIIYILCSIVFFLFSKYYVKKDIHILTLIENILAITGTPYAWYIEMYIGLFLFIPFLNLIFNNLNNKKDAQKLILTLLFIIGIPSIVNIFKFYPLSWWKNPASNAEYTKLLPSWWMNSYPIFYYFLGAYLRQYEINLNKIWNITLLFLVLILDGVFNFYRSYNAEYIIGTWNNYYSATTMLITFLVFNLLLKIKPRNNKIKNCIMKTLSDACLGAYLISCIFDNIAYTKLNNSILLIEDRFIYAPIIIIFVFISSLILSLLINEIYKIGQYLIKKLLSKRISQINT